MDDRHLAALSLNSSLPFRELCDAAAELYPDRVLATSFSASLTVLFTILIIFMQAGFAALEAGMTQAIHARNILLKNILDMCVGALVYMLVGYGVSFGDGDGFIGTNKFAMVGFEQENSIDDCFATNFTDWFFNFAFAAASATIVSGAIAERVRVEAYLLVSVCVTGLVYPMIARWMWYKGGWLVKMGAIDFSGSGVVHLTGGVIGLVGAAAVGFRNKHTSDRSLSPPRFERVEGGWVQNYLPPSSEHMATLGTFLLSIGWVAFNVGVYVVMYDGGSFAGQDLGRIASNTILASSTCALSCVLIGFFVSRRRTQLEEGMFVGVSVDDALYGILAGLVGVTAGCALVTPGFAILIGVLSAATYKLAASALVRCRIDDPLNAYPVHGACGALGLVAVGLFAHPVYVERLYGVETGGIVYGYSSLLGPQVLSAVVITLWAGLLGGVVFMAMRRADESYGRGLFFLRPDEAESQVSFGQTNVSRQGRPSHGPQSSHLTTRMTGAPPVGMIRLSGAVSAAPGDRQSVPMDAAVPLYAVDRGSSTSGEFVVHAVDRRLNDFARQSDDSSIDGHYPQKHGGSDSHGTSERPAHRMKVRAKGRSKRR